MRAVNPIAIRLAALLLAASVAHAQAPAAEAEATAEPAEAEAAAEGEAAPVAEVKPDPEKKKPERKKGLPLPELSAALDRQLVAERAADLERLERFRESKKQMARNLEEAKATLVREERVSESLENRYTDNEVAFERDTKRLEERLGQLGELFGVVRQVSTDASGNMWASLTSAQLGQRKELLDRLGRSKELPSTTDLELLWFELQREMTAQGQVTKFQAPVLVESGEVEPREVTRVGTFAALADGRYLKWEPKEGKLRQLSRQPPARYTNTVEDFAANENGYTALAVDPSRGTLMEALTATPYTHERVAQGGSVGYVIISLAAIALVIGAWRWAVVTFTGRRVSAQEKSRSASLENPLGRVIATYEENKDLDPEHLEQKLEDVVLKENANLTRMLWLIRTVSVVAPLLGLLGTVTGMIQTFQAITLFGTGDPKVMAGGISEALVTTMLGLIAAIPLVLLYETLSSSTRRVMNTLDENVANMIAARTEATHV